MPDEHRGGRAGAGRLGDLLHRRGLGGREVLGDAAGDLGQHEADDDGAEHAQPGVGDACRRRVADVDEGEDERCRCTVRMPAVRKPRLIGVMADLSVSLAGTAKTPTIEASTPMARQPSGKMAPAAHRPGLVGEDGLEGGDAEDDRRHQGDLVALEQVGGHAGAVAHVVAHVVGDGGRVAGVVLGDAGLDLADEVGADVGRLGEDAAADPQEQGEQRAAEAEADEDGRAGVLEDHDDERGAEQAEADGEHAGHAAGAERHLAGRPGIEPVLAAAAVRTLPRTARLMPMKPVRPDRRQPSRKASGAEGAGLGEAQRLGRAVGLLRPRPR